MNYLAITAMYWWATTYNIDLKYKNIQDAINSVKKKKHIDGNKYYFSWKS